VKPAGLDGLESWAWDNASESVRRRIAWAKGLERQSKEKRDEWEAGGVWPGPGPEPPEWARGWSASGSAWRQRSENARERRAIMTDAEWEDWKARNPLYIRFGGLPSGKLSAASEDMPNDPKWEKGISVFRAHKTLEGDYVVDTAPVPTQVEMFWMCLHEKRPAFLAEGREVGTGGDGEPVLEDVTLTPIPEGATIRASGHWERWVRLRWGVARALGGSPFLQERPAPRYDADLEWPDGVEGFPGARGLVEEVLERSTGKTSDLHGPEHWKRVAVAGAALCAETPEADPLTVFLFALFHDAARIYDTFDTWHGWRAAELARELLGDGDVLTPERLETLAYALEHHDTGKVSEDPTIGACWDADRLNLWRIGVTPDPALLSTVAAKEPGRIEWARGLEGTPFSWADACACYHPEPSVAALREPPADAAPLEDPREHVREIRRRESRPTRREVYSYADTPEPTKPLAPTEMRRQREELDAAMKAQRDLRRMREEYEAMKPPPWSGARR
jgi:uncharacterized protein